MTVATLPLAAVLELVAMQLEVAMQNAASQADGLSTSVADVTRLGSTLVARLRATGDAELATLASRLEAEANRALVAMQFHDQLAQRVMHVREALSDVHDELLSERNPDWAALLGRMRSHYTMEDERRLFDMVLGALPGAPAKQDESLPSSVELF